MNCVSLFSNYGTSLIQDILLSYWCHCTLDVPVVCRLLQAEIDGVLYIEVLGVTHEIYFFAYHLPLLHIERKTKLICIDNTWEI